MKVSRQTAEKEQRTLALIDTADCIPLRGLPPAVSRDCLDGRDEVHGKGSVLGKRKGLELHLPVLTRN